MNLRHSCTTSNAEHFIAAGRRLRSAGEYTRGNIVKVYSDGAALVHWDYGPETSCTIHDIESA